MNKMPVTALFLGILLFFPASSLADPNASQRPASEKTWLPEFDEFADQAEPPRNFFAAEEFLRICESDALPDQAFCVGFISGVSDSLQTNQQLGLMREEVCLPPDLPRSHGPLMVRNAVVANMKAATERTPALLRITATQTVYFALRSAAPCEGAWEGTSLRSGPDVPYIAGGLGALGG